MMFVVLWCDVMFVVLCCCCGAVQSAIEVVVGNVGDCRCLLGRAETGEFVALTEDHKPLNPEERARIVAAGGCVIEARLVGLAVFVFAVFRLGLGLGLGCESSPLSTHSLYEWRCCVPAFFEGPVLCLAVLVLVDDVVAVLCCAVHGFLGVGVGAPCLAWGLRMGSWRCRVQSETSNTRETLA